MTDPIEYEAPDYTPEEMKQEPPFTFAHAEMINFDARAKRTERRTNWMAWACVAAILGCVILLGVML